MRPVRLVLLSSSLLACAPGSDTGTPSTCPVTPGAWAAPSGAPEVAVALALRGQLDQLSGVTMRGVEQGTVSLEGLEQLQAEYEAGDPSLAAITTAAYAPVVQEALEDFVALASSGNTDLFDDQARFAPGAVGGITPDGARGFNPGGLEVRQLVEKGLYAGGAFYPWAQALTAGTITPATVEAIAAIWGADEALGDERTDAASYSHAMGLFGPIAQALTDARAYAADEDCVAERDAALVQVFRRWEQAMVLRCVDYAAFAVDVIATASTEADVVDGLHELTEGLALVLSFRGLPAPTDGPLADAARVIPDARIDAVLEAFGVQVGDLGASTTGAFASDAAALQAALEEAEAEIGAAYGLSDAEVEAYRDPSEG